MQSPVKRTSARTDVYEAKYILGKRKRKVRQFPFYVFRLSCNTHRTLFFFLTLVATSEPGILQQLLFVFCFRENEGFFSSGAAGKV